MVRRAADERTFLVAGEGAWISGREDTGPEAVRIGPLRPLRALRGGPPPAQRVELSPGILRRDLRRGGSGVAPAVETLLAFNELPAVVFQWSPAAGEDARLALSLSWVCELPAEIGEQEERRSESRALSLDDGKGEPRLLYLAAARRARWRVAPRPGGKRRSVGIDLELEGEPGAPVTLLVSAPGSGGESARFLARRLSSLASEAVRWSDAGTGGAETRLTLASPEREVDRSLAWASSRVAAWRCAMPFRRSDRSRLARGLLATGRFGALRELLEGWLDLLVEERARAAGAAPGDEGPAACLQAAGAYGLWSGDRSWLAERRPAIDALSTALSAGGGRDDEPDPAFGALQALAAAVELPGGDGWSRTLRDRTVALEAGETGGSSVAPEDPDTDPVSGTAGEGWEEDPERAFARWRRRLLRGMREEGGHWGSPAAAGLLPSALLFGMLGARADAPFGRLRLAPLVPGPWSRLDVEGIRIGDAAVRLGYRRSERRHTFVLQQTRGRVPVNLVFEPALPTAAPGLVRVDGRPAEVERRRLGAWRGFRLQFPLDSPREVSVDREARDGS